MRRSLRELPHSFKAAVVTQLAMVCVLTVSTATAAQLTGVVLDDATGKPIPCRVYVQAEKGDWIYVQSADPKGSALAYREQWVPMATSVEKHTTLSAHPFRAELPAGKYTITVERGKEYHTLTREIVMGDAAQRVELRLKRWIDLASRGWYSGETHVHRRVRELPNAMLAEDLNVAFPVTFWTTNAYQAPGLDPSPLRRQGPSPFGPRRDYGADPIPVDKTHVIFPRNTEYEIFSIDGKRHVLGAVFVLNHKTVFREGMPPVSKIAAQARREGALLDLDKHSWPWSMMLIPIAKIDLYELSNNSVWRTKFGFRRAGFTPPAYMNVERDEGGMTERGWLEFGFQNYYSLLNCGFRLRPTAGTASGVHPVPLGHSRVYAHVEGEFSGEKWIEQLRNGRSFVTTSPALFGQVDQERAGHVFRSPSPITKQLRGEAIAPAPLDKIEIIVNGRIVKSIKPANKSTALGAYRSTFDVPLEFKESGWVVARCFHKGPDGKRVRFAHTAPWFVVIDDKPPRPRKAEMDFLISRVSGEIERNRELLAPEALAEFERALKIYQEIARRQ
ncbi:MAG: CehA/McbA family metallohydrolase [Pirellulaceae bacterium]|nr:CehA/McbA family metallohydrolase [Pirellulaceae bacterium]MDP7020048.1 CehA/McbA family metallohydrolase [Pirellulaceae bacterium]